LPVSVDKHSVFPDQIKILVIVVSTNMVDIPFLFPSNNSLLKMPANGKKNLFETLKGILT